MADSTKDHDTSMALTWVVMLLNDFVALSKKNSETIRGLLMMQQVQVSIMSSVLFKLHI